MLIIDENVSEIEVWRLREWGIAVRQIGPDIAAASVSDENILPILHRLKRPTFFTRDQDFWSPLHVHAKYCLVFLDIREHEGLIASTIRRFLRHTAFDTHAKRMGKVIRLYPSTVCFWQHGKRSLQSVAWKEE
jgi:hypothetical protein